MTYARVDNGQVASIGPLPAAVRLADGRTVLNLAAEPDLIIEAGYRPLSGDPPEHDPATHRAVPDGYSVHDDHVERHHRIEPRAPRLTVTPDTLPADGETTTTVTYIDATAAAPTVVTFDVNGVTQDADLVDDRATIAVTADQPGLVEITCQGLAATVDVED